MHNRMNTFQVLLKIKLSHLIWFQKNTINYFFFFFRVTQAKSSTRHIFDFLSLPPFSVLSAFTDNRHAINRLQLCRRDQQKWWLTKSSRLLNGPQLFDAFDFVVVVVAFFENDVDFPPFDLVEVSLAKCFWSALNPFRFDTSDFSIWLPNVQPLWLLTNFSPWTILNKKISLFLFLR